MVQSTKSLVQLTKMMSMCIPVVVINGHVSNGLKVCKKRSAKSLSHSFTSTGIKQHSLFTHPSFIHIATVPQFNGQYELGRQLPDLGQHPLRCRLIPVYLPMQLWPSALKINLWQAASAQRFGFVWLRLMILGSPVLPGAACC